MAAIALWTAGRKSIAAMAAPTEAVPTEAFSRRLLPAYGILRKLGVPLGKADFMGFLAPHVRAMDSPV